MFNPSKIYDVLVVGGGNAGLCAAITARQAGASVLLLEQAPRELRGGNGRHARNMRIAHDGPSAYLHGVYPGDEFADDLARVAGGEIREPLARLMIDESAHLVPWMEECGARFQRSPRGASEPSRKTAFLLGGGKALLNAYYQTAQHLAVDILYDSEALASPLEEGFARDASLVVAGVPTTAHAHAVVVASGGLQANLAWLEHHWGESADQFVIRGTPYATGRMLADLLDQGVAPVGDQAQCHIVAVDARAPKFDGGIVTRLAGIPFGIVVDRQGRRFHDEGIETGPRRFSLWGRLVAQRADKTACAIFDARGEALFRPSIYPPIRAATIADLAQRLTLDPNGLAETVRAFNGAVKCGAPDLGPGEGWHTEGIVPAKTRWALPLDTPPFAAYPMRPGITFSYLGVKVDERARVLMQDGKPMENVFAAGSIMAANVLGRGYLAGTGMTIGTVFGRIAGREAAKHANQRSHRERTPRFGNLQRMPVLRRILRGVRGHGAAPRLCNVRPLLPGASVP